MKDRILAAIKYSGKTQRKIAIEIGVTPQSITKWLKLGVINRDSAAGLAKATGVSLMWLTYGQGGMVEQGLENTSGLLGRYKTKQVPLISWAMAGEFCDVGYQEIKSDQAFLPCPLPIGPRGYALTVKGDAMTSPFPGDRTYPEGCVIYVDPDKPITNGCRVIAFIEGTNEATFKVYVEDAGQLWLKPINPQYPMIPITDSTTICGVVVCKMVPE